MENEKTKKYQEPKEHQETPETLETQETVSVFCLGVCDSRSEPADASLSGEAGRLATTTDPHLQLPPLLQARP